MGQGDFRLHEYKVFWAFFASRGRRSKGCLNPVGIGESQCPAGVPGGSVGARGGQTSAQTRSLLRYPGKGEESREAFGQETGPEADIGFYHLRKTHGADRCGGKSDRQS